MAVTIPGAGGAWTDLGTDASTLARSATRRISRQFWPAGKWSARPTIEGTKFHFAGHPRRIFLGTLTFGACCENIAAWRPQIIEELWDRGFNCVRLHHVDSLAGSPGGILASGGANWYSLDATGVSRLADTINQIRWRGLCYSLDFNSWMGSGDQSGRVIFGDDANAIWEEAGFTAVDTTVASGDDSITQVLASAAGIEVGMELYFHEADDSATVVSIDGSTVELSAAIGTQTDERVTPAIARFKQLPPFNAEASDQLKAYITNLLGISLGDAAIGEDPHLLYATVTNEMIPGTFTTAGTVGLIMDAAYGSAWAHTSSAALSWFCQECLDWLENDFRPWMAAQGWGDIPLAWGSQFGRSKTEFDPLWSAMDVDAEHIYHPVATGTGVTLDPRKPFMISSGIANLYTVQSGIDDAPPRWELPRIVGEELGAADPSRFRAEIFPHGAIHCAARDEAGMGTFQHADGGYNPGTIPALSNLEIQTDRSLDVSLIPAWAIFVRSDLLPLGQWTPRNYAQEDRTAETWLVDTERTLCMAGESFLAAFQDGQSIETDAWALSFVVAMDGPRAIREARRLLIGHVTNLQRRNRVFADDFTSMSNAGSGNMCLAQGTAEVGFYHHAPSKIVIYRLNHDGSRGNTVATGVSGNLVSFTADNSSTPTLLYEAVLVG